MKQSVETKTKHHTGCAAIHYAARVLRISNVAREPRCGRPLRSHVRDFALHKIRACARAHLVCRYRIRSHYRLENAHARARIREQRQVGQLSSSTESDLPRNGIAVIRLPGHYGRLCHNHITCCVSASAARIVPIENNDISTPAAHRPPPPPPPSSSPSTSSTPGRQKQVQSRSGATKTRAASAARKGAIRPGGT